MKITKGLATAGLALSLAAAGIGIAPLAQASTTCFTGPETVFLGDLNQLGILYPNNQLAVDDGWHIKFDVQRGSSPANEAAYLYYNSSATYGGHGLTLAQAQLEVASALTDLRGSPSPGGAWSGPDTPWLGVCDTPENIAGHRFANGLA